MVARARRYEETGDMYADNLREEARAMKFRLKGRYVWKTFYPIDSMDNLPKNAQVLERNEDSGAMIPTKVFDPSKRQHYVKFPPYHASDDSKRKTFSQQRVIARTLEKALAESNSSETSTEASDLAEGEG